MADRFRKLLVAEPINSSKRPQSFEAYRSLNIDGRFHTLQTMSVDLTDVKIELAPCDVLWDPRFGRDILPVHQEIQSRFVNRGFECMFASFAAESILSSAEIAAASLMKLSESREMCDVLASLDGEGLVIGGMAVVESAFLNDALVFGLTSGAYAPWRSDPEPSRRRVDRYLEVFPGTSTKFEVFALSPRLSTWFWNDWLDFFFVVVCPEKRWVAVYAGSDTD